MNVSGFASRTSCPASFAFAVSALPRRFADDRTAILRNAIHRQKPGVVRRELILDAGISKTDNQLHAAVPLPSLTTDN